MKKLFLIICSIIVFGCGGAFNIDAFECVSEFTTSGMYFCVGYNTNKRFNMKNIENIVQYAEEEAYKYYPQVIDFSDKLEKHGVQVFITDKYVGDNCQPSAFAPIYECDDFYNGINFSGETIFLHNDVHNMCLSESSLPHELLHSIQYIYEIDLDGGHDTEYFFMQNYDIFEYQYTIEARLKEKLRNTCK